LLEPSPVLLGFEPTTFQLVGRCFTTRPPGLAFSHPRNQVLGGMKFTGGEAEGSRGVCVDILGGGKHVLWLTCMSFVPQLESLITENTLTTGSLWSRVKSLWDRLEVAAGDRAEFEKRYTGCSHPTIQAVSLCDPASSVNAT